MMTAIPKMFELLLCALNKTLSDLPGYFMECFYTKRILKKIDWAIFMFLSRVSLMKGFSLVTKQNM